MDALHILLLYSKKCPSSFDPFLRQYIATWDVAALYQLCLEGAELLASLFTKQHIHNCLAAKRGVWHTVSSVSTGKPQAVSVWHLANPGMVITACNRLVEALLGNKAWLTVTHDACPLTDRFKLLQTFSFSIKLEDLQKRAAEVGC